MYSHNQGSTDVNDLNSFNNFSEQVAEYDMLKQVTTCKFLSFRSSVDEASVLLQYDTASLGIWFAILQDHYVVSKRQEQYTQ
jgi:hypothetical protein